MNSNFIVSVEWDIQMFLLKDVTTNEFMKVSEMKDEIITGFMRSSLESLKNKKKTVGSWDLVLPSQIEVFLCSSVINFA